MLLAIPARATDLTGAVDAYNTAAAGLETKWILYESALNEYFVLYKRKYDYFNLYLQNAGVDQEAADEHFGLYEYWQGQLVAFFPDMDAVFHEYRNRVEMLLSQLQEIVELDELDEASVAYSCGTFFVQPAYPPPVWEDPEYDLEPNPEIAFPQLCVGDNTHESWDPLASWWETALEWVANLLGFGDAVTIAQAGIAAQNVQTLGSDIFESWCSFCLCEISYDDIPEEWQREECIGLFCTLTASQEWCPNQRNEIANAKLRLDAVLTACPELRAAMLGKHQDEAEQELTAYWSAQLDA